MSIEIIRHKEIKKGYLQFIISAKMKLWGNLIVHKIKIFQKNNSRWTSFPNEEYEKDGEKKYSPLIEFEDKKLAEAYSKKILEAFDKYLQDEHQKSNENFPKNEQKPF